MYYFFIFLIQVEKSVRRRIESFLLGNSGPEAFYEVQGNIVQLLKERVYLNFILTDFYTQFVQQYDSLNHGTYKNHRNGNSTSDVEFTLNNKVIRYLIAIAI